MSFAPIVMFVYNRPIQTLKTLNALKENIFADESDLYIYCDGPKANSDIDKIETINEVRRIAKELSGFKKVIVKEELINKGLANSIIDGVSEIINIYGKVIVLEDDILTSKFFLQFMNDSLTAYENEDKVFSVGACNYFAEGKNYDSSFFIPIPDCWGWATWENRWRNFKKDANKLLSELEQANMVEAFDLFGFYKFSNMLKDQLSGKVDSWAIRWQANCYLQHKLVIYPNPSITQHLHSKTGTHIKGLDVLPHLADKKVEVLIEKPYLKFDVYIAMIKAYFFSFVQGRFKLLKLNIRFYSILIWYKNRICAYVKSHKL